MLEKFSEVFTLTEAVDKPSVFEKMGIPLKSGVYNNGLLQVLTEEDSKEFINGWKFLKRKKCKVLMTNSYGDIFYLKNDCICYLNPNVNPELITDKMELFLDNFLILDNIHKAILLKENTNILIDKLGALQYGYMYAPIPYIVFGGNEGNLDSYDKVVASVYYYILGQIFGQI